MEPGREKQTPGCRLSCSYVISQRGLNAGWRKRRRIVNGYPLQVVDQGFLVIFLFVERVVRHGQGDRSCVVSHHCFEFCSWKSELQELRDVVVYRPIITSPWFGVSGVFYGMESSDWL
jgi:hypothetical protein